MITLTLTFETKKELCEFLAANVTSDNGMPTTAKVEKPKAGKPKASKPKAEKPKGDAPTATQVELRKALKAFANNHDPSEARKFLESCGYGKISEIKDGPAEYGSILASLKTREEELNNE